MSTDTALVPVNSHLPPVFGGQLPKGLAQLRPLVDNAFEAWLKKTESHATRTAYRNDVEQFLAFHGLDPTHIEQMTRMVPDDVTTWRDHLLREGGRPDKTGNPRPASNATVARKITALRSFFSFLQIAGYRGGNPAHPNFVKSPHVPTHGKTVAISPKECALLITAPDADTPVGLRDRAILHALAFMAPRVDEVRLLTVGSIKRDGEHTTIEFKGKGNKPRRGVVPPLAATPINNWIRCAGLEEDRSGPLFRPMLAPRGNGASGFKRKHLTTRAIQKLVKKYAAGIGLDVAVTVHSLRVTATTEGDKAGSSILELQQWLGHADPRTTIGYIRSSQNLDRSPAYVLRYG